MDTNKTTLFGDVINISNYNGVYDAQKSYEKFDFVYNPNDGKYYYATDNIPYKELSVLEFPQRFSLDADGPIYDGVQTYYLFDSNNDMSDFAIGQKISIGGSQLGNDGDFKILKIEKSYNPDAITSNDTLLNEVLDAPEGIVDWFSSSWFLLGKNNIYWPGRDFEKYVNSYRDLSEAYEDYSALQSKSDWGKDHYNNYGKLEGRSLPLNDRANWMYHADGWGWLFTKTKPEQSAIWFNSNFNPDIWWYTKQSWVDGNRSLVYFDQKGYYDTGIEVTQERIESGDTNFDEIDVSDDSNHMIVRRENSIYKYEKVGADWQQKAELQINGRYRYLTCDNNCSRIAVMSYENKYYIHRPQEYFGETFYKESGFPWLIAPDKDIKSYQRSFWGVKERSNIWEAVYEDVRSRGDIDWESCQIEIFGANNIDVAGDVVIYKYNESTEQWEEDFRITEIREKELSVNFTFDAEKIFVSHEEIYLFDYERWQDASKNYKIDLSYQSIELYDLLNQKRELELSCSLIYSNWVWSSDSPWYFASGDVINYSKIYPNANKSELPDYKQNGLTRIMFSGLGFYSNAYPTLSIDGTFMVYQKDSTQLQVLKKIGEYWEFDETIILKDVFQENLTIDKIVISRDNQSMFFIHGSNWSSKKIDGLKLVDGEWKPIKRFQINSGKNIIFSRDTGSSFKIGVGGVDPKEIYDDNARYGLSDQKIYELRNDEWTKIGEVDGLDMACNFDMTKIFSVNFENTSGITAFRMGEVLFYDAFGEKEGTLICEPSDSPYYVMNAYHIEGEKWYAIPKEKAFTTLQSPYGSKYNNFTQPPPGITATVEQPQDVESINDTSTRVWLRGYTEADQISTSEPKSNNILTITSKDINPEPDSEEWKSDLFFFDADYGSSVKVTANNFRYEFGNGYYILQPKHINSLTFEADLKFNNRSNRETNAIIHFLENHQGQNQDQVDSPNLTYTKGMVGFRWDGNSTFHPYDSTEVQSKNFYCLDFSHSLDFENSNTINAKIKNIDTSILRKSDSMFVKPADSYSSDIYYQENDVVFVPQNHRYYYCKKATPKTDLSPIIEQSKWDRKGGYYRDANVDYWSRDFFWKPSIGLTVGQKPRLRNISVGNSATQIYRDGINEGLLSLDLKFENREDDEAYAILHFLEMHYGCIPFLFSAPAPYETPRNFVCQEWTHTYNYKNNHTITAKFEQFPFALSAEKYDGIISESIETEGELIFPASVELNDFDQSINFLSRLRKRIVIENVGDLPVFIDSIDIEPVTASVNSIERIGTSPTNLVVIPKKLTSNDYVIVLPPDTSLPFGLANQRVQIAKTMVDGFDGGVQFSIVDFVNGRYVKRKINNVNSLFYQNNFGQILNGVTGEFDVNYRASILTSFFDNNGTNVLAGGENGYFDIEYNASLNKQDDFSYIINGLTQGFHKEKEFKSKLKIKSNARFPNQESTLVIYLTS